MDESTNSQNQKESNTEVNQVSSKVDLPNTIRGFVFCPKNAWLNIILKHFLVYDVQQWLVIWYYTYTLFLVKVALIKNVIHLQNSSFQLHEAMEIGSIFMPWCTISNQKLTHHIDHTLMHITRITWLPDSTIKTSSQGSLKVQTIFSI